MTQRRSDRGAILLWVAIMLVLLLSMTAFVIDVGALYRERRELQNGADAGALAVAQDCAEGDCLDEFGTAGTYADANASDDFSAVDEVCGLGPGLSICAVSPADLPVGALGWVRVATSTETPGGGSEVSFFFAPVFDAFGSTVEAEAIAAWGLPTEATTLPLTFSECEYDYFLETIGLGEETHIYFHKSDEADEVAEECDVGPAGHDAPGGFGWLDDDDGDCAPTISEGTTGGEEGNDFLSQCEEILRQAVDSGEPVAIPIFEAIEGEGHNTTYTIVGFAGFIITGYKLASGGGGGVGATYPAGFLCPAGPGKSATCIRGTFTDVAVHGSIGGTDDFGARVVEMIG